MIQFLRKLFGLGGQVPADAPVDMHIVLDPKEEEPVPAKPKPAAKPKKAPAKKAAAPKKEIAVKAEGKKRGRPSKG
jgi:hypothetical protein